MLQSSNQYLRPDYLAAPTVNLEQQHLDTKSSPLALLAQTCSAIGADTTNPKLLAANIEKSTKSFKATTGGENRDKSSPVSSHSSSVSTGSVEQQQQQQQQFKSSFKPYESNNNHVRDRLEAEAERAANLSLSAIGGQRVKTPKSNSTGSAAAASGTTQNGQGGAQLQQQSQSQSQQQQQRCDSNQSATSQRDSPAANGLRRTPNANTVPAVGVAELQQRSRASSSPHQQRVSSREPITNNTSIAQPSPNPTIATSTASRLQSASDAAYAAAAKEASYVKALHAAAAAAGIPTSAASTGPYYTGYPSGAVTTGSGMPYPMDLMTASALMSPHHPMFKAAALNPYLNYARLKGLDPATAAAMMAPNICRDPYCTGCPSTPHYLNKAAGQACPAGCPQCEAGSNGKPSGSAGGSSSAMAAAAAASSYHAQLAALAAASQMPYVCSWIGGDAAYCGKRFSTSDELFQHLRTHTASMPDSVLSAAAAGGIPPNHPLFQRTYPTPPLSPLSAATRYHPYGKPSMLPPSLAPPGSLAGLSMPPHPALAQYFSPYSLYGPRMGSSHP